MATDRGSPHRPLRAFGAVFLLLFLAPATVVLAGWVRGAPASAGARRPVGADAASAGQILYEERCATCHGEDGRGTGLGPAIAGLGPAWYDFMLSTGRMPLDSPTAQAVRKPPAFSPPEIAQLIAYLETLPPGDGLPIPRADPQFGDLSRGQEVYELNCASCHGATGNGGAVGPQVAPALHVATATQIAEAARIGPGTMPVFDQQTITDQDLDSATRYILYLRDPRDAGGAGLDHAGPIIEGFVALLIGLGAAVLVTRYIGARP